MKHELNIQPKYYNYILNGTKRIELRLYDEKRSKININDVIKFTNSEDQTMSFNAKVIGLLRYSSFQDLFKDFSIEILSDKSMDKEELLSVLGEFYTLEKQNEFGVIGIKIKLI